MIRVVLALVVLGVLGALVAVAAASRSPDRPVGIASLATTTPASPVGTPTQAATPAPEAPSVDPTPAPTPVASQPTPSPSPRSILERHQVVANYGNPYSPVMGILGEYEIPELIRQLRVQAQQYQALNNEQAVLPALHLIYAVAQGGPGDDGSFLYHMPDEVVERYIAETAAAGLLLFIDLQMGRADPLSEVEQVRGWLRHEHVHLAVDPEFTMAAGERPGVDLGSMDAATINRIQALLGEITLEAGVSNKILIVHQFQGDMIVDKAGIAGDERVDLVIDLDGWGPPAGKLEKYAALATDEPVEYTGFKLFYRWDKPMMSPADVQALTPRPRVVIYQ